MIPEGWKAFGGGGGTSLHPAALVLLVLGVLLIWYVPRSHILKPLLALAIVIPLSQQVVVFGLHLMVLRIVIACAWLRLGPRIWRDRRFLCGGGNSTDAIFASWVCWSAIAYTLAWGDVGALLPKLGFLWNAFGLYFLFRHVIRDESDIDRTMVSLAVICAVVAILMSIEQVTGRNLLAIFGTREFADVRQGRIRSQASFAHSIIAGTFGACLMPVFLAQWWARRCRFYAIVGVLATAVMVIASSSSTPVGAAVAGIVAMCFWPLRRQMRPIRWGLLAILTTLHLIMEAPVWALLGRVRFVGGSTSWHRFSLIDHCIRNVGEWWLIGTTNNAGWGFDMWDTANWYVSAAVGGGLIGLGLFIALIAVSFRSVGIARHFNEKHIADERFVWGLGAALFASTVGFLGIEFFDQSVVAWYVLLTLIATVRVCAEVASRAKEPADWSSPASARQPRSKECSEPACGRDSDLGGFDHGECSIPLPNC